MSLRQRWTVFEGNAFRELEKLADGSIHVAATSPPYWGGLRNYGHDEQLGHEPTPQIYAYRLGDIFDVLKTKLRKDGTLWLNLGDSYIGSGGAGGDYNEGGQKAGQDKFPGSRRTLRTDSVDLGLSPFQVIALLNAGWLPPDTLKDKDLAGAPWAVARELRRRGWLLRADVIWHKKNPMPGGGHLDRPSITHEYVFQLAVSDRIFYDGFAVREQTEESKTKGVAPEFRNRRSVWKTGVSSFTGAHFATFPPDLVHPMIQASTSERGVCRDCGAPWRRIVEKSKSTFAKTKEKVGFTTDTLKKLADHSGRGVDKNAKSATGGTPHLEPAQARTVGWEPTCVCDAGEPVPATVIDPFAGAGSTGVAALKLGRNFVGIELVATYVDIIERRLKEAAPYALGEVLRAVEGSVA